MRVFRGINVRWHSQRLQLFSHIEEAVGSSPTVPTNENRHFQRIHDNNR